jgi:hypothetical protein
MTILAFRLLITPFFIGTVTLAGRRWGPTVNGLLVGLPLTTGPISFILAHMYGLEFAAKAASGNLAGQIAMCTFCLVYSLAAQKSGWHISTFVSVAAYMLMTFLLNQTTWQLVPAFIALILIIVLTAQFIPHEEQSSFTVLHPRWDLPARMIIATTFVYLLTNFANMLGSQLSGLISTFPIFGVVFAAFTHHQQGAKAVVNLLRGIVLGSAAYAFFFLTIGEVLPKLGITWTYPLALAAILAVNGIFYFSAQSKRTSLD